MQFVADDEITKGPVFFLKHGVNIIYKLYTIMMGGLKKMDHF